MSLLRRSPLKPGKGFKRPVYERKPVVLVPRGTPPRGVFARSSGAARVAPKENRLQHAGYMAAVRQLPCARCGIFRPGLIQFCHRDEGKGERLKTDCREGWPGCGPHDGLPGCHWIVGTSGRLPKEERRAFELEAGKRTRAAIVAAGKWPKRLPMWEEAS